MGLRELYKAGDSLGFLAEFKRLYGNRGGAVALWQDFCMVADVLGEPLEEALEEDLNSEPVDYVDVWAHPDAIDRGWIVKRWEDP